MNEPTITWRPVRPTDPPWNFEVLVWDNIFGASIARRVGDEEWITPRGEDLWIVSPPEWWMPLPDSPEIHAQKLALADPLTFKDAARVAEKWLDKQQCQNELARVSELLNDVLKVARFPFSDRSGELALRIAEYLRPVALTDDVFDEEADMKHHGRTMERMGKWND